MNNIDRMYTPTRRIARGYLEYLQAVLRRIDPAEIGRFIRTLLDARERAATIFLSAMVAARRQPVILPMTCRSELTIRQAISGIQPDDNVPILTQLAMIWL